MEVNQEHKREPLVLVLLLNKCWFHLFHKYILHLVSQKTLDYQLSLSTPAVSYSKYPQSEGLSRPLHLAVLRASDPLLLLFFGGLLGAALAVARSDRLLDWAMARLLGLAVVVMLSSAMPEVGRPDEHATAQSVENAALVENGGEKGEVGVRPQDK